jgi:hypothetical protein
MNVEIGTEAAQFPEEEYINGILVAMQLPGNGIRQLSMPQNSTQSSGMDDFHHSM